MCFDMCSPEGALFGKAVERVGGRAQLEEVWPGPLPVQALLPDCRCNGTSQLPPVPVAITFLP